LIIHIQTLIEILDFQKRYDAWLVDIIQSYGSVVNYLMNHRLRWGQPDALSLLKSDLVPNIAEPLHSDITIPISSVNPPYFSWETPSQFISIIENDWPYSVPTEVEHTLVWTKLPIYHLDLVAESIKTRIDQDGLWGFTGNDQPPPLPSNLSSCISKLAEWGITMDTMVKSEPPTEEEKNLLQKAGSEVHRYVKNRWIEKEWETAWFVNPPRLQSVPGLAHIHVFARRK